MSPSVAARTHEAIDRILSLELPRDRARRHIGGAAARPAAMKRRRIRPRSTPCGASSAHWRLPVRSSSGGRARRSADALHRRRTRHRRTQGRHRGRSARGHDAVRQEHAGRDRHHGDGAGRHASQCARRLHGKIAIGPGYPSGVVDLDLPPGENIARSPRPRGQAAEITALILERPRHAEIIAAVRKAGAAVRLITDGDVAGIIHTAQPDATASTSISASAARRRACSPRRRCAASAARFNAVWCSTPRRSACVPPKWG